MNTKNTQRITEWINEEPDNFFINPGYSPVFSDEQIQLGNKELMQICAHCLSVPRFLLFFKCGHLTCLLCLYKYYKLNFNFKLKSDVQRANILVTWMKYILTKKKKSSILTPFL